MSFCNKKIKQENKRVNLIMSKRPVYIDSIDRKTFYEAGNELVKRREKRNALRTKRSD